jgi:hypothetical protein
MGGEKLAQLFPRLTFPKKEIITNFIHVILM